MSPSLKDKKIVLGITGSVAIYRACDLIRLLAAEGATVQVVLSRSAENLIQPSLFEALSGRPVWTEESADTAYAHLVPAQRSDYLVVAPATANFLAQAAQGMAGDLLSTIFLAFDPTKTLIAPAMNTRMYQHPNTTKNLARLAEIGVRIAGVESGALACGEYGEGRLAALSTIVQQVRALPLPQDLAGKRVLITAGPTREALDPVRFLSNRSSGRMGAALAEAAAARGAEVTLIHGPLSARLPDLIQSIAIESADELAAAVKKQLSKNDILIAAAAVSDFKPINISVNKLKKTDKKSHTLELESTPDVLIECAKLKKQTQLFVGFALESKDLLQSGEKKLKQKKLDLIVLNTPPALGGTQSQLTLLDRNGVVEDLPKQEKTLSASLIVERLIRMLG